jgi:hypothetical protein
MSALPDDPLYEKKLGFRTLLESALQQKNWSLRDLENAARAANVHG